MAIQWVATDFGGPEVLHQRTLVLPPPGDGEVTIEVRAAGMNPADFKHIGPGQDPRLLPLTLGYEVAGLVTAIGPGTALASGGGAVGDEVVAWQILGGYATALTVSAADVFAKPAALDFAQAANLLLVGTTASEMLHVTKVTTGDTVLLHGAAGAVGTSVLQQARLLGARVIGTASAANFDHVRRYGATPVEYGPGLEDRAYRRPRRGSARPWTRSAATRPLTSPWPSSLTGNESSPSPLSDGPRKKGYRSSARPTRPAALTGPASASGSCNWPATESSRCRSGPPTP